MNIQLLQKELTRDEGVRFSPYKDTKDIMTVGIGHNLQSSPISYSYPLTQDQVNQIFASDVQNVIKDLNANIPWWSSLDEVRQRVLANMTFNLGINGLLAFKNTINLIKCGNYAAAAEGMKNSKWYNQVGARADRLCQAMRTGVMPQ